MTFDFGQTLADLDAHMLARRLAERGVAAEPQRLDASGPAAWRAYNAAIRAGAGGHPWKLLMSRLLEGAGVEPSHVAPLVDWLWTEQPSKNLWRRPVPGMIELVRELVDAGVPVGIVSNSEGRLAELAEELGWRALFEVIADSGKLGFQKPGREIFDWTADRLGVACDAIVHVGDAYVADVEGALGAGARAIWFRGETSAETASQARLCVSGDAESVREALSAWGLPLARTR